MKKFLIGLLLGLATWQLLSTVSTVELPPGVMAPNEPAQTAKPSAVPFTFKGYRITPAATFELTAKVLSRKRYRAGREAELSPVDLALGWGNMSDQAVVDKVRISQRGRWYSWRVWKYPIPRREIETHSANMHLIPADGAIEGRIKKAARGNIIRLSGKLVEIEAPDGWRWNSSMSREDVGGRSCELVFVEDFHILH